MSPPLLKATAIARRQSREASAPGVFSAPVIIGIAAGGAVLLCILLTILGLYIAKVNHRRKKARQRQVDTGQDVGKDLRAVLEIREQDMWSRRHSFTRLPSPDKLSSMNWITDDFKEVPVTSTAPKPQKKLSLSPQRGFFRISGMRDSWPLVSKMDIPPQHIIQAQQESHKPLGSSDGTSQAVGESVGCLDNKWPSRTYSRASRQTFEMANSPEKKSNSREVEEKSHRRRSTSESQLSSILRSTSQRLRRQSLTRARSSIGRFPGSPPKDRLPSPPPEAERPSKGRAKISTPDPSSYAGSINSSIYETYINRSPSPSRMVAKSAGHILQKRENSPTHSYSSGDSLCRTRTPDLVIPAALSSPSKREKRTEQRHTVRISTSVAPDLKPMVRNDQLPSSGNIGDENTMLHSQHVVSDNDPFYSQRSSSPPAAKEAMPGPRPLNIRKTTFGAETTLNHFSNYDPKSIEPPLRDVSGNEQSSPTPFMSGALPGTPQSPFQWLPEETMQVKKASLASRTLGPKKKGHKRSHTVHMSILPAPQSFGVVPELPEEESPPSIQLQPRPLNISAPCSPSRGVSSHQVLFKTPSPLGFNQDTKAASLPNNKTNISIHRDGSSQDSDGISSTLMASNYYSEEANDSEDEFFNQGASSRADYRRQGYDFSAVVPSANGNLTSFPSPRFTAVDTSECDTSQRLPLTRPSSLIISSPTLSQAVLSQIKQAPGPQGPREEVGKKGMTMETQIAMLRRMNSEVSSYSEVGSPCSDGSPTLPDLRCVGISPVGKASNKASKHYLGIGNGSSPTRRKGRPSIRNSMLRGRVSEKLERERERRASKMLGEGIDRREREGFIIRKTIQTQETIMYDPDDFFSGGQLVPMKPAKKTTEVNETVVYDPEEFFCGGNLVPMKPTKAIKPEPQENESPKGLNIHSLNYPILSPEGQSTVSTKQNHNINQNSNSKSPPSPELSAEEKRWSDAMLKPQLNGLRSQRQSRMEMPTPMTPPRWASIDRSSLEKDPRPDSLGLYDQDGFLKSSPERARLTNMALQLT
ncbi:hypothetical protein PVAG01_04633 [Phlyctema vagabunda]|uniref:Uncharacterized protein n=1 Tax=Phlyctema vagabunda TaxID=108571 RepID=A0ABR4PIR1_9HELO